MLQRIHLEKKNRRNGSTIGAQDSASSNQILKLVVPLRSLISRLRTNDEVHVAPLLQTGDAKILLWVVPS
jgi:hypothetical protein